MKPGRWCPSEANEITASETCSGVSSCRTRISTTGTISSGVITTYAMSHQGETIHARGWEGGDEGRAAVDTKGLKAT